MKSDDFNWLVEHAREIDQKYAGKWIAVCDNELVGVGDTATEAAEQARRSAPGKRFVLEAIDVEGDVVYAQL